jgi:hypothetical protein
MVTLPVSPAGMPIAPPRAGENPCLRAVAKGYGRPSVAEGLPKLKRRQQAALIPHRVRTYLLLQQPVPLWRETGLI